jgi:hypothetical protein
MFNQRKEFIVMTDQFSQIRWWRVTWTALAVYGASFLIVFCIITAYASYLAFQARGAPDQTMIQAFAGQYASWLGTVSLSLFTLLGALWLRRFVQTGLQLHGLMLGLLVGLVSLLFDIGSFGLDTLLTTVLVIASGWLGGRVALRKE